MNVRMYVYMVATYIHTYILLNIYTYIKDLMHTYKKDTYSKYENVTYLLPCECPLV